MTLQVYKNEPYRVLHSEKPEWKCGAGTLKQKERNWFSKTPPPQLEVSFKTGLCEGRGEWRDWFVKGLVPLLLRELSMMPGVCL